MHNNNSESLRIIPDTYKKHTLCCIKVSKNVNFVFKMSIENGTNKNETTFAQFLIQFKMIKCNVLYRYCAMFHDRKDLGRDQS